jgi:VWFA-related protein
MDLISRRSLLLSAAPVVAAATRLVRAQAPQQQPTFSSETRVVNVLATVRTKKGEIVKNLTKDDFTLAEDGHPQVIKYFSQETDLPLTLGLLVDTSGSQRRVLGEEVSATRSFLDTVLREDRDQGFLIHFDAEAELLQDLTSSRQLLQRALNDVGSPQLQRNRQGGGGSGGGYPGGGGGYPGGGGGGRRGGGGTVLYDSVLLASDELMARQKGRKALIVLTDGVDNGSKVTLNRAIEAAQRSDTMVYGLLFEDKDAYNQASPRMGGGRHGGMGGGRPQQAQHADGKKVLQQLARETGGGYFEVSKKTSLEQIYAQVQEELRNQYSLGYTPEGGSGSGYRRIQLTTKKDLVVQARDGYFADK